MAGEVRNVKVRLSVENAQAIAATKAFGDAAEKSAARAEASGRKIGVTNQQVARGARNIAVVGAAALVGMERSVAGFDKQMSAVDAATHETTRNMALLREAAIKAGADTSFSASEAAQGITELAKAGVSTKAVLGGGLKGALDLAAAGQLSVAEAAETAASAMTQFRLKGKDVPHIADLLAAGAGKAQGSVHDLGMALNQSGLVASQTGLSIEDTTGTLAAFAKAGLIGSDAGTSFKTMLLSLNPRSDEAGKLMKRYNIQAYDAQGNFIGITKYAGKLRDGLKGLSDQQRAAALQTIFGTDAIRAANILYRNGATGIDKWTKKVNDQGYAADTAGRQLDNLAGDFEKLKGSLETAFIKSGSGAQSGLRDITQDVDGLIHKFNDLPAGVQSNVVKAVAALTGLSAGVFAVSKVVGAVTTIRGGFRGGAKGPAGVVAKATGVVPVFVTNPGFGKPGTNLPDVPGTTTKPGGAPPVVPLGSKILTGLGFGAAIAGTAKLAQETVNLGDTWLKSSKAGDHLTGTQASLRKELGQSNVGKYAKDLHIDLDALAADMQANGDKGKYFTKVMKDLEIKGFGENLNKTAGVLNPFGDTKAVKGNQASMDLEKISKAQKDVAAGSAVTARGFQATYDAMSKVSPQVGRYAKTLRTVPREIRSYVSTPGAALSMESMGRLARQYKLTPKQVRTIMALQGFSKTQAEIVIAGQRYRSLPKAVRTAISSPGAIKSEADVNRLVKRYNLTPKQKATVMKVSGVDAAIAKVRALQIAVANTRGKEIAIHVKRTGGGVGIAKAKADGGQVFADAGQSRGPRDDSIDAVLSHREYVQPVAAVDYYGERMMEEIRARRFPKPIGYADGGLVGGSVAAFSGSSTGATAVTVVFPAPAILKASVAAADRIAISAARTARSSRETRAAHLEDLHAQQQIRQLQHDLNATEKIRVRGRDGKDDDKSKKGLQDRYKNVRRYEVRGIDRTVAAAELRDAKATLKELRAGYDEIEALRESRTTSRDTLTGFGDIFARSSPASSNAYIQREIADLTAFGDTMARLKAAGASGALLAQMKAKGESGDFKAATRFGKALLDQPVLLGQLNASLSTYGKVAGNVATLTSDPRFSSNTKWNPGNTVAKQVQVLVQVDPSAQTAEITRQVTHNVLMAIGGP